MVEDQNGTYLTFGSLKREEWLEQISFIRNNYDIEAYEERVRIVFDDTLQAENFQPIHFVTLACLIQFLYNKGHSLYVSTKNESVVSVLFKQLRFQEYWQGGQNHVDASDNNVLNLWRIVESEKDPYSREVERYFKNKFFRGKELSVISLSLAEVYYNVFDHAEAEGNAFSFIQYEESTELLHVGICDFGKGIAKTVRDFNPAIQSDADALMTAIEDGFTVGSKGHNRGKGLDNILSCSSVVRILSNNALLIKKEGIPIRAREASFHFGGTLIYLEIDLGQREDEEILEEFGL